MIMNMIFMQGIGILRILMVKFMATGWAFSLGNRYTRTESDQVTTEFDYTINPKWKFKIYNSFPVVKATDGNITSARENEFVLTRDLHEWEMDLAIDQTGRTGHNILCPFPSKSVSGHEV